MVKEVSKVPVGMTSEILEMNPPSFGMFKVIDRKQGAYAAFDEVKDNVRQMIIDDKYETKVNEAIQVAKVNINREVYADTLFR
ncbi:hypothetical protein D3C85_1655280 [compost metagenome]